MKRVLKWVICLGFVVVLLLMGIKALRSRVPQYLFTDGAAMEEPLADEMPYKEAVLAPCRMLRSALGQRIFPENDCYITDDGYMVSGGGAADVTPAADGVERLCDFCEEHGIGFLHVTTAFKPQYDEDASSAGMWCYRNANADALAAELDARVQNGEDHFHARTRLSPSLRPAGSRTSTCARRFAATTITSAGSMRATTTGTARRGSTRRGS